jgi:hypothetical protein
MMTRILSLNLVRIQTLIYIFDPIDPDAKVYGLDLRDSCNADDCEAGANVAGDNDDDDTGGGYDDEDDNEDWVLWDANDITIWYHFMTHLVINHFRVDKCLFLHMIFMLFFSETLFQK